MNDMGDGVDMLTTVLLGVLLGVAIGTVVVLFL